LLGVLVIPTSASACGSGSAGDIYGGSDPKCQDTTAAGNATAGNAPSQLATVATVSASVGATTPGSSSTQTVTSVACDISVDCPNFHSVAWCTLHGDAPDCDPVNYGAYCNNRNGFIYWQVLETRHPLFNDVPFRTVCRITAPVDPRVFAEQLFAE